MATQVQVGAHAEEGQPALGGGGSRGKGGGPERAVGDLSEGEGEEALLKGSSSHSRSFSKRDGWAFTRIGSLGSAL